MSLAATIEHWAKSAPDETFVESARSDVKVTYRELAARFRKFAGGDHAAPVTLEAGDPIEFAVAYVSLIAAGATVVPLAPNSPENEALIKRALEAGAGGATLMFSSGSSGARKLIRLAEAQLLHAADAIATHHKLGPGERGFNSLPLHHINAEVVGLLATLRSGATLVLDAAFHKTGFWKLVSDSRSTWINAVPAIVAILSNEDSSSYDLSNVRFARSASSPLAIAVLERFEAAHGIPVVETYGMTEAASQICANPLNGLRRPGSVGLPVGVELRMVDHGVQIRGDSVVTNYVGGASADRFTDDGWLITGDEGYIDGDGYLFLVGRSDDVINSAGEKIFPREIEELLLSHPGVNEVLVVPLADEVRGQVPVALFVAATGATAQLSKMCDSALAKGKRPVEFISVAAIPRGVTGKLSRRAAAALAAELTKR